MSDRCRELRAAIDRSESRISSIKHRIAAGLAAGLDGRALAAMAYELNGAQRSHDYLIRSLDHFTVREEPL